MKGWTGTRRGVVVASVAVLALVAVLVAVGVRIGERSGSGTADTSGQGRARSTVVASDRFDRTVARGWGTADLGGDWRARSNDPLAVGSGSASMTFGAGTGTTVSLSSLQPADLRVSVDVTVPDLTTAGAGVYTGIETRSSAGFFYRCDLRLTRGEAFLSISRQDGLTAQPRTLVREHRVASGVEQGQVFHLVCQDSGSDPVQLFASASRGDPPREWQVRGADDTASRIRGGGQTGLRAYISGSAARQQVVRFDAFEALALSAADADAPPGGSSPRSTPSASPPGASSGEVSRAARPIVLGRSGARAVGTTAYAPPAGALYAASAADPGGDGSRARPYASLASAVAAARSGSTIVLRGGTYHESVVLPPGRRLTVQAYPGEAVWLDGSSAVTGWRAVGDAWVVDGWDHLFDASPTYTQGAPEDPRPGWQFVGEAHPMAAHPDQVWVDGRAQEQVATRSDVRDGAFYVDEAARRLVLGTDPGGRAVRASTLATALTIVGEGDVVRGIGVRRYATSVWQLGAVTVNVPRVRLSDVVVEQNATTGLSVIASDVELRRVTARGNGLMGVHANHADRLRLVGLSVSGNNTERFNRSPAAGGMKVTSSADVVVRGSRFARNLGHGLWCDEGCADLQVARSTFDRNEGSGTVFEISSGATIAGNLYRGNALDGLWLIDSDRVEVAGNAFVDNRRTFSLTTDDRWVDAQGDMPWVLRDVAVYDNLVRQEGATCVVCLDDRAGLVDPDATSVRFDHNLYQRPGWTGDSPFAVWPADQNLRDGTIDLVTFRDQRGQETRGLQVGDGEHLLDASDRPTDRALELGSTVARPASRAVVGALGAGCATRVFGPVC